MPAASLASSPAPAKGQEFDVRPFTEKVGVEIVGLDLSKPLSDADFARVHQAHLDYHLVVFRDQHITPQQQVDFSRRFGVLQIHVLKQFLLANHPEILIVSNIVENGQPVGLGDAGKYWHSDLSYKELPSLGSMLYAQELPSEGGDTLFATCIWPGKRCRSICAKPWKAAKRFTATPPVTQKAITPPAGARP
jgi:taurine dioxygenase